MIQGSLPDLLLPHEERPRKKCIHKDRSSNQSTWDSKKGSKLFKLMDFEIFID